MSILIPQASAYTLVKRAIDVGLCLLGVALTWPLLVLIAFVIKATSRGPIFYSQVRVGRNGRLFKLHKFRTMVRGADGMGSSVTVGHDSRVTAIGRLLRRTKADELPQIWNVLAGEMSLVGPRPEVPEIVAQYDEPMRRVLTVRPGITSVASLYFRDEEELLARLYDPEHAYVALVVPFKVALGMQHVDRQSTYFDLKFLFLTIYALTLGKLWQLDDPPVMTRFREELLANCGKEAASHEAK